MPATNLIAKLRGYFPVGHDLRTDLNQLATKRINLAPGEALIRAGEKHKCMYLVEDGWVLRGRYLPGGSRQIVNFALPGDFLCYNMLMFERSDFDLIAKTPASLWELVTKDFRTMMARHPGLAEALVWSASRSACSLSATSRSTCEVSLSVW